MNLLVIIISIVVPFKSIRLLLTCYFGFQLSNFPLHLGVSVFLASFDSIFQRAEHPLNPHICQRTQQVQQMLGLKTPESTSSVVLNPMDEYINDGLLTVRRIKRKGDTPYVSTARFSIGKQRRFMCLNLLKQPSENLFYVCSANKH